MFVHPIYNGVCINFGECDVWGVPECVEAGEGPQPQGQLGAGSIGAEGEEEEKEGRRRSCAVRKNSGALKMEMTSNAGEAAVPEPDAKEPKCAAENADAEPKMVMEIERRPTPGTQRNQADKAKKGKGGETHERMQE